jgi:ferritin-like protein
MFLWMSSESYHESLELLSEDTKNAHRALVSLKEELEAVDWYQQRAEACSDPELAAVLTHNKNEEIEHAMMTLEWLRRKNPVFAKNIGIYVNSSGPITEVEAASMAADGSRDASTGAPVDMSASLGIGSLKGNK